MFLGMSVTYKDDGTVKVIMKDHLQSAITVFSDNITTSVTTPAQRDLFEVDNTREKLSVEKSENSRCYSMPTQFTTSKDLMIM